jgi:hypothetical protein
MRRWKLFVALVGLAMLVAGAVVLWPPPKLITRESFGSIRTGMTRAEVEAIVGSPGDSHDWTDFSSGSASRDPLAFRRMDH